MAISKKVREIVYQKYDCKCAYCGTELKEMKDMQVDHIITKQRLSDHYLLQGKSIDDLSNLNPACRSCNKFKDTFSIEMFREQIQGQINKFRKYHPTFNLAERYGLFTCNEKVEVKFYYELIKNK